MAEPVVWILASVVVVSLLSLAGALGLLIPGIRSHGVLMFLVALAAGTLIGDSFLHLLPQAAAEGSVDAVFGWTIIGGFLLMFFLETLLHWQHSHIEHVDELHSSHEHIAPFGWLNLVSDALHNLLDGVVVAAAYLFDITAGIATTIAVAFHEIPQELGDFAVLLRAGMKPGKALLLNLGSGLFALFGAGLVLLAGLSVATLETWGLPLIAGAFLYIAAADLIPELHHHARGREVGIIVGGLLLGLLLMGWLLDLEAFLPGGDPHAHE